MDHLNAVGSGVEVVKPICRRVSGWINAVWNLENNTHILTEKKELLVARETDIRRALKRAVEQRKEASKEVDLLLEHIVKIVQEVSAIASSVEQNMRCFFDFRSRLKLAKRVVMATQEVDELLGETSQFTTELAVDQSQPIALTMPTPSLVDKSTVGRNMAFILEALKDPVIGKIGVYGMGGSGKTTTMMKINNQLAETVEFDKIIWVIVPKDMQLENVQNQIVKQLNVDLSTCGNNVHRVDRLFARLKGVKRYLIILDDMWERMPLEEVGIPQPDTENKCKIVLTTRSLAICHGMETDKNIKLALLSTEEAWDLFVNKAGKEVLAPEVQPLAKQVIHKCGGLPLAINTVGRAMRQEGNIRVWRTALEDLKNSPTDIIRMEEEVFNLLRFSYNRLRNDTLRKCFLYAALYPEDSGILKDELIKYWIGDNLIKEKGALEKEVDKGHKLLKELLDACLFEQHGLDEFVMMHDTLRDLAIDIMREDGGVLIKAGLALHESPTANEWDNTSKISLVINEIQALPDQPDCPNLSILLLWHNPLRQTIPSTFFTRMHSLQVLDVSRTQVTELPSSLSNLVKLRALFLQYCPNLNEIPSLAKLKKLQVLDLSRTSIKEVPHGVEGLISLRYLNLSFTKQLKNCATFKFTHLEELYLCESSIFWETNSSTVAKCMEEIGSLNRLRILHMSLRLDDYRSAFTLVRWGQLKNFDIRGYDPRMYSDSNETTQNSVHIHDQEISNHHNSYLLPADTEELQMFRCEIQRLSELLCLRSLRFLKLCVVRQCKLRSGDCLMLWDETKEYTFTSLEHLKLYSLKEITVLAKGMPPRGCLGNLKILEVTECCELKDLIFINLVQHLKNIESISVEYCVKLEVLVGSNGEGHNFDNVNSTTTVILPNLHTLILRHLPELQSLSKQMWVCISLCRLDVFNCPKLKNLPFSDESLSNLQKIKGESEWWDSLEWDAIDTKNLLNPRFKDFREWEGSV